MKKRVLFIGEHPRSATGNGNMMAAILNQLDPEPYEAVCFAAGQLDIYFDRDPYKVIPAQEGGDYWGSRKLIRTIQKLAPDALVTVGIDIWRYAHIYKQLGELRNQFKYKAIALFPYDLWSVRQDWVKWIKFFDYPCVYSEYGFKMLDAHVPGLRYFRPPLYLQELFTPGPKNRDQVFQSISPDAFVFGFVGANQFRKDPKRILEAFRVVKTKHPESVLYLHTEMDTKSGGVFNLTQTATDLGFQTGDIITKHAGVAYHREELASLYRAMDCFVNCSCQEGLSWTPIEAMLSGVPVILSDTTAHTELGQGGSAYLVRCEDRTLVPVITGSGQTMIDSWIPKVDDIARVMVRMIKDKDFREETAVAGLERAKAWVYGSDNINDFLDEVVDKPAPKRVSKKRPAILFAQHSSAGDVFMTTRCFKGLKERHFGVPLVYMTQKKYHDILVGNPYVDEIIDWDESIGREDYEWYYNPHKERILPGHWGRNSNSILSDFYWKILKVEPGEFFIQKVEPKLFSPVVYGPVCIVHTTGGDPQFRTYKYMADVCRRIKDMGLITIQVGGVNDYPAGASVDLRALLSFRETAWVMSKAKVAVTVDSFISHLAGALGISQVCLFGSGNANVVRPNQMGGRLICMEPDYIKCPSLGPCSAAERSCPAPCTGVHDPKDIVGNVISLLEDNQK